MKCWVAQQIDLLAEDGSVVKYSRQNGDSR